MTYSRKGTSPEVDKSYSAHLTHNKQPKKIKNSYMAQKKETEKKDVKVKDLAPQKDAKGGARSLDKANAADGSVRNMDGIRNLDRGVQADGMRSAE
jgi:hypothetical protein